VKPNLWHMSYGATVPYFSAHFGRTDCTSNTSLFVCYVRGFRSVTLIFQSFYASFSTIIHQIWELKIFCYISVFAYQLVFHVCFWLKMCRSVSLL